MRQNGSPRSGPQRRKKESTIFNFIRWTQSGRKKYHDEDLDTFTVKSKLALTAFVNSLIKTHRKELISTDGVKCTKYTHNCMYIALRQCYELDLRSQKVVSELIREIFLCEGNLHAIFSVLAEGHVTRGIPRSGDLNIHTFTLYPNANRRNFSYTVIPALEYYLKSIVILEKDEREKEIARYQPKSLLNRPMSMDQNLTPLMAAAMRKDPDLVLILLRYGADPTVTMETSEYSPLINPIQYTVTCLNSFTSIKSSSWIDKYHPCDKINGDDEKCYQILQHLQRAVYHIDFRVTSTLLSNNNESENIYYLHPRLAGSLVTNTAPSLQHLSRCALRNHLSSVSSETIPGAIKHLPLPYIIQEFLDLKI